MIQTIFRVAEARDKKPNENTYKKVVERSENKTTAMTGEAFKIGYGTTDADGDRLHWSFPPQIVPGKKTNETVRSQCMVPTANLFQIFVFITRSKNSIFYKE